MGFDEAVCVMEDVLDEFISTASYWREEAFDDAGEYYECMQAADACNRKAQALSVVLDALKRQKS